MPNTIIHYTYRDAFNYKTSFDAIVEGSLTKEEITTIRSKLDDGKFFIPDEVGLPDLQDSFSGSDSEWDPDRDHPWHSLDEIKETSLAPNIESTAQELYRSFREVEW